MAFSSKARFWEIDFARGIAVLMMLLFNWQFALFFFGLLPSFNASSGFWWFFARLTGGLFIFIAGVSLYVSFARASRSLGEKELQRKYLTRGLEVFGLGMLITLATALFLKSGFIVFGILHSIGLSVILAFPFLRWREKRLVVAGAAFLALGVLLSAFSFSFPWLLWLGFVPNGFYTLDYFPLLPWFGVFILGLAFGKRFYAKASGGVGLSLGGESVLARAIGFLGRHSLAIYLVHQPLLIALLLLAGVHLPLNWF